MAVNMSLFEPGALPPELYDGAFEGVGRLLGASTVEVVVDPN